MKKIRLGKVKVNLLVLLFASSFLFGEKLNLHSWNENTKGLKEIIQKSHDFFESLIVLDGINSPKAVSTTNLQVTWLADPSGGSAPTYRNSANSYFTASNMSVNGVVQNGIKNCNGVNSNAATVYKGQNITTTLTTRNYSVRLYEFYVQHVAGNPARNVTVRIRNNSTGQTTTLTSNVNIYRGQCFGNETRNINYTMSPNTSYTVTFALNSSGWLDNPRFTAQATADKRPIARNDAFTTNSGSSVSGNVMNNNGSGADTAGDGSTTVVSNTNPSKGRVTVNSNGTFTYTPNSGASGTDTFRYTIRDADGDTSTATVTITINTPVCNDPNKYGDNCDFDGDGLINSEDLDDDNDGILDTDECTNSTNSYSPGSNSGKIRIFRHHYDVGEEANAIAANTNFNSTSSNGYPIRNVATSNLSNTIQNLSNTATYSYPNQTRSELGIIRFYIDRRGLECIYGDDVDIRFKVLGVSRNRVYVDGEGDFSNINDDWSSGDVRVTNPTGPQETSAYEVVQNDNLDWLAVTYYTVDAIRDNNFQIQVRTGSGEWSHIDKSVIYPDTATRTGTCTLAACDFDDDGIDNQFDLDSDDDGCFDAIEGGMNLTSDDLASNGSLSGNVNSNGVPTSAGNGQSVGTSQNASAFDSECDDNDGDGIVDSIDLDDDNDGILDTVEGTGDADNDGIPNHLDLDSDGDGCFDSLEGGGNISESQLNADGSIAGGVYPNGVPRLFPPTVGQPIGTSQNASELDSNCADNDGDGIVDRIDLDDDNDGILDTVEGTGDSDNDGTPDVFDLDSDNDGCFDAIEGGANFANSNLSSDGSLSGNVSSTGIPIQAGNGQSLGTSQNASQLDANCSLDLSVTKTVDNANAVKGDNVTFTIVAKNNNSKGTATGVVVNDVLPSGYTYVSNTRTKGTWSAPNWTIGSLANGASETLTITATVKDSGNYQNTASINGDQEDLNTSNDSSSATVTPSDRSADLQVTKTVNNANAVKGDNVTFTIVAKNNGDYDATGVVVNDVLPSGFTYVSNTRTKGTWSAPNWTIGSLADGASETLTITATVKDSGNYQNTASISGNETDPTSSNNSSSVTVTPTDRSADLQVTKTANLTNVTIGENIRFTIVVKNNGSSAATGVVVNDALPSGYTFVSNTVSQGTWSAPNWTVGNLANGASATLTITATANATGNYSNTATVTGNEGDPDSSNNSSTVTPTIDIPECDDVNKYDDYCDFDGDGKLNIDDLDDDNDGILDTVEGTGDTDEDEIPNKFDLDSDGDGCFDAQEGGDAIAFDKLNSNGSINSTVTSNGIPVIVNANTGQTIGTSQNDAEVAEECIPTVPCNPINDPGIVTPGKININPGESNSFVLSGNESVDVIRWEIEPSRGVSKSSGTGAATGDVFFTLAGTYNIIYYLENSSNPEGCNVPAHSFATNTFTVVEQPPACNTPSTPTIAITPSDAAIPVDDKASFALTGGTPNTGIQWRVSPPSGASPAAGTGANTGDITFSRAGIYTVIYSVINEGDFTCDPVQASATAQIAVGVDPCSAPSNLVVIPNVDVSDVEEGDTVSFAANGGTPGAITWEISPANAVDKSSGTGATTGNIKVLKEGIITITFTSTNSTSPAGCTAPTTISKSTAFEVKGKDTDGDGIPDATDLDDDNDGIPDSVENATATNNGDTDGDGIPDSLDLDSDNDGLPDLLESGIPEDQIVDLDKDNNGVIDPTVPVGTNGIADSLEPNNTDGGTSKDDIDYDNDGTKDSPKDTDGDGKPDFQDVDSDNDGISDLVEGGTNPALDTNNDGKLDNATDTDGDGLADTIDDNDNGFGGDESKDAPDTDNDGIPDYQDLDSDDDGINDVEEAGVPDTNGDGMDDTPNTSLADGDNLPDSDDDGTPNYQEPNGPVITGPDTDQDGIKDSEDGLPNEFGDALVDTDGDGIPDSVDLDDDNDGIPDSVEGFNATNPDQSTDTDGDGTPDYLDTDTDNDGISDLMESGIPQSQIPLVDQNKDGMIDASVPVGNNGIADFIEPNNTNQGLTTDNVDYNDDGTNDDPRDTDNDSIGDWRDLDSDDDGINDVIEGGSLDTNGDGQVDTEGTLVNPGSLPDTDNNGTPDVLEPNGPVITGPDTDKDGIKDSVDGKPNEFGDAPIDTDGDGINDADDVDDDNDGIPDTVENATASNNGDTDGDGIPDSLDLDSDNDGITDLEEAGIDEPTLANLDPDQNGRIDQTPFGNTFAVGENGLVDVLEPNNQDGGKGVDTVDYDNNPSTEDKPVDTDGDGKPDFQDVDSDNDGISDLVEGGTNPALDANNDGMIDNPTDTDGDGIANPVDKDNGGTPATTPDTDSDGIPDYQDLDSDDDGINDVEEAGVPDTNGDGMDDTPNTSLADGDNLPETDGKPNYQEPNGPVITGPDTDQDGIKDSEDGKPEEFGDAPIATTPDYFARIFTSNTIITEDSEPVDFVVMIGEIEGGDSNGTDPVEYVIVKQSELSIDFDNTLTTLNGRTVNNKDWKLEEDDFTYKFIYTGNGGIFTGDSASMVGVNATFTPQSGTKGTYPLKVTIQAGSGGETNSKNNVDIDYIEF